MTCVAARPRALVLPTLGPSSDKHGSDGGYSCSRRPDGNDAPGSSWPCRHLYHLRNDR